MLVLKTTSPNFSPLAPKPRPTNTVPSSRASLAGTCPIVCPPPPWCCAGDKFILLYGGGAQQEGTGGPGDAYANAGCGQRYLMATAMPASWIWRCPLHAAAKNSSSRSLRDAESTE